MWSCCSRRNHCLTQELRLLWLEVSSNDDFLPRVQDHSHQAQLSFSNISPSTLQGRALQPWPTGCLDKPFCPVSGTYCSIEAPIQAELVAGTLWALVYARCPAAQPSGKPGIVMTTQNVVQPPVQPENEVDLRWNSKCHSGRGRVSRRKVVVSLAATVVGHYQRTRPQICQVFIEFHGSVVRYILVLPKGPSAPGLRNIRDSVSWGSISQQQLSMHSGQGIRSTLPRHRVWLENIITRYGYTEKQLRYKSITVI